MTGRPGGPDVDVLVVGAGVAGLRTALALSGVRRVLLVDAGELAGGSTPWAQGGLAAAVGPDDSPELHAADTMSAGAGACRREAVDAVVGDAPALLGDLMGLGVQLDRDGSGDLDLTREGGHSRHRVAHHADRSGAEVARALVAAVRGSAVEVREHTAVVDLLVAEGRVTGAVLAGADGVESLSARAVVLATGGVGGLYERSTNPAAVSGLGLALALRAGATLRDLEFVQFHPTGLDVPTSHQVPLLTEALRGEGAVLLDARGRRVTEGVHPLGDLAPRDVVARAVDAAGALGPVVLDARPIGAAALRRRFPGVVAIAAAAGLDVTREPLPVVATQHFLCGGVATDLGGATDVPGLFAVGEVAATGLHGANRLASNSLVEGAVLGRRTAARLAASLPRRVAEGCPARLETVTSSERPASPAELGRVRAVLTAAAGVRRTRVGLEAGLAALAGLTSDEALVARALVSAAAARTHSRGCHWRDDDPSPTDESWTGHVGVRVAHGRLVVTAPSRTEEPVQVPA